jgi:ribosomal protein S26
MLAPSLQLQYCISCSIYAVIVLADYVVVAIVTIVV